MKDDVDRAEIAKANELIDGMSTFKESLENAITHLERNSGGSLWKVFEELITNNSILKKISEFKLAPVKPCILEFADGGPGVGVRLLCFTILTDVPEFIVQRILVDGGSLKWEEYEQYHA